MKVLFTLLITIVIQFNFSIANELGIIGSDDREIIHDPSNDKRTEDILVGKIYISKGAEKMGSCSGTLIGPNLVLTAAHCFHNAGENTIYADVATFSLQASGENRSYRPVKVKKLLLPAEYFDYYDQGLEATKINKEQIQCDFACLVLEENLGDEVGWHSIKYDTDVPDIPLTLVGYPGDKKGYLTYEQCNAVETHYYGGIYNLNCDLVKGVSGSGVIEKETGHVWGVVSGVGRYENYGMRFTKESFNTLKNWYQGNTDGEDTYKYTMETKNDYTIEFINECHVTINIAYKVKKDDGYEIDGFYVVHPKESLSIRGVRSETFWFYAKSEKGKWTGSKSIYLEDYKRSYNFIERNMKLYDPVGTYYQKFKCD